MVSAYNILKHVHRDECDGRVEVEGAGLHVTVSTCAGTAPQRPHQTLHHLYLPPSNMLTSHIFSHLRSPEPLTHHRINWIGNKVTYRHCINAVAGTLVDC